MEKSVKRTLYWGIGIVVGFAAAAFIYYEVRLQLIYMKMSSIDEANAIMQNPNLTIVAVSDPVLDVSTDDSTYQYNNNGADQLDGVTVNGVVFTGDATTAIYVDSNGFVYDGNQDTITDTSGNASYVDPSAVVYGTINADGSFSAD